ncbi:exonuclease family protein [Mycobacterium xenopi 3993]|nr:exonuclease family protein [Mycobacterium xenopi 3993]
MKVRGGAVLGEFATLVDPQRDIPPQIVRLTGITTAMVCDAPTIGAVLPMFFDFARGAVLVPTMPASTWRSCVPPPSAYTSPGRGAGAVHGGLARRVLSREEAPSVQLAALARLFAVASQPTHRALADARATVEVLHALLERVGNQGVHTYADLRAYLPGLTPAQRSKRTLAEDLPHRPGLPVSGTFRRGPLRWHGNRLAPQGDSVLQRRGPACTDQGAGRAGRPHRPCRVRARAGSRRA